MTDKVNDEKEPGNQSEPRDPGDTTLGRRSFLRAGIGAAAALGTSAFVLDPLRGLRDAPNREAFLRSHYKRLTPDLLDQILRRVEVEVGRDYGAKVHVGDYKPIEGVEFAYALNLTRCNGSRRCVQACMQENNVPADHPEMAYIRVLEMPNDTLDLEDGDPLYKVEKVPEEDKFYFPISCQQCRKPPCTKVCPVHATWTQDDGITVIDYNWCIGCRCCMAACPYEARRFNWTTPQLAPEAINPDMGYLSNRIRPRGVPEKCHFCLHRTRQGKNPACMEVCPTGSRVFGNILDPNGKIQYILKNKRVYVLKQDAQTFPRFYYFFEK